MCIDFDGHHSNGSSFVYVNDFCYYRNCLYTHRYKFSSEKKKTGKESQYIVSRPELRSNPPFGSDRESGCDTIIVRDSDLYLYIPEGIITIRDSDLCHVICDPNGVVYTRRYHPFTRQ